MPSSRSSSLSRSNIRSKASSEAVVAVLRHGVADLGLGQRPAGVEQAEDEVEQALGLGRRQTAGLIATCLTDASGRVAGQSDATRRDRLGHRMIQWREVSWSTVRRRWAGAVEYAVAAWPAAGDAGAGRWPTPAVVGDPRSGDRVLLNVTALRAGPGHRWSRAGRRRCPTGCRPTRRRRAGPRRQGALHPAAGDGPRRRRAGQPAPRACCADGRRPRRACRSSSPTCTPPCRRCSPGCASAGPGARVAYVMTDGGALPIAFSRTVAGAARGRLAGRRRSPSARRSAATSRRSTCTPACSPPRHVVGADVAVVIQGPGNLGTGTRWGFSGVAAGEAVNAAATLGGRAGGLAAGLGGRPARAAPRRLPPQPHGVRPGGARRRPTCRCRCCPASVRRAGARARRARWCAAAAVGCASYEVAVDGLDGGPARRARCGCRRWAAGCDEDRAGVPRRGRRRAVRRPAAASRSLTARLASGALSGRRRGRRRRSASRRA